MAVTKWCANRQFSDLLGMRSALNELLSAVRSNVALNEDRWYDLKIVLRELCCNALEHGRSPVEVTVANCGSGYLHVLVCDAGEGFDPCALRYAHDQDAERGRGLHIVDHLTESMAYNAAANKILVRMQL